jgi:hypothetical protein
MSFVKLTRSDDEPVWVNLEHVHHIVRSGDLTILRFATAGGDETVSVKEIPPDIFRKI